MKKLFTVIIPLFVLLALVFSIGYQYRDWQSNKGYYTYAEDYASSEDNRTYPYVPWVICPEHSIISYMFNEPNIHMSGNEVTIKDVYVLNTRGSSMFPAIPVKTRLLIQPFYSERMNLSVGMIMVSEDVLGSPEDVEPFGTVHRIVALPDNGKIITKGDNNRRCEQWDIEQIDYVVRGVIY